MERRPFHAEALKRATQTLQGLGMRNGSKVEIFRMDGFVSKNL